MHPLEIYLQELAQTHSTGANVKELSFYPLLKDLFDAAGNELKPKVRCVLNLKNMGSGNPDGGFFTVLQFRNGNQDTAIQQLPERGAVEVKSPRDDVGDITVSEQVKGYLQRYGLVMVTNLRDFALAQLDSHGNPAILERYCLAETESEFWQMTRRPRRAADLHGARLMEFLKRAMLYRAELTDPKDLAWFLASYARDARAQVDSAGDLPALNSLRQSMQAALNMEFTGEKGEHFFRSTLVQTLFYGVFSAWVLWHHANPASHQQFDWRLSTFNLKVPVIQSLFHQLSDPSRLRALGITRYLDLTGAVLNRVRREAFFAVFDAGQAVQYFYEPFLEAYDPELRKELGVWYTPPEIVQYMVERVDRVLRSELGLADGLADPQVVVLDPCCGTGAYPLEVLKRIARTLRSKGDDALLGYELKKAAMQRVFGFEILAAPFVISHLQIGLLLQTSGAPLADDERAAVYLTNALTGWEPPRIPKSHLPFPELEQERDAAGHVKQEAPILVILGNPPYNAFAGVADSEEEKAIIEPYKEALISRWGIKKFNLDDLYIRFFRLAERRIAEFGKRGVVCFISNFSYLSDPSYVVMRQRFVDGFDALWFDCLNGDSRETGKLTPEGLPDPSVFSTESNREGIRLGTVIGLMVRKPQRSPQKQHHFRHFWGVNKRAELLASLADPQFDAAYQPASPAPANRYSFRPANVSPQYMGWAKITEFCAEKPFVGLEECRGGALIDIDSEKLKKRMEDYLNPNHDWEMIRQIIPRLTVDSARFNAKVTRQKVMAVESFDQNRMRRYLFHPYDQRWCYYSPIRSLWNEPRPTLWEQCWDGNEFIISRMNCQIQPEGVPFSYTKGLFDKQVTSRNPIAIPFRLKKEKVLPADQLTFLSNDSTYIANLSDKSRAYLASLGISDPDNPAPLENNLPAYALIWLHALAVGFSPAYLRENADGVRQDYPRIPLPASRAHLFASAALGKQIAALLDSDIPLPGVTSGEIRPDLKSIARLRRVDESQIDPQRGDLALTAGWGHSGKDGVVMPGQGKIVAGGGSLDVYLNDSVYWQNIPSEVWEYAIGGYQVIKKWLSYRENKILGRALTVEEAREVTGIARRLTAIIALHPSLDANYLQIKENLYPWD